MTYSSDVLALSPIAYYRHGEPSGTTMTDSSGNSRNGTYTSAAGLGAASLLVGDSDTAYSAALARYGSVADAAWMDVANISISTIIKLTTVGTNRGIASRFEGSPSWLTWINVSGQIAVRFYNATTSVDLAWTTAPSTATTYHIVATYDGTTARLYVNGTQRASSTAISGNLRTSTATLAVGSYISGGPFIMDGVIDETAIFDYALTSGNVTTLYNSSITSGTISGGLAEEADSALAGQVNQALTGGLAAETDEALAGTVSNGTIVNGGLAEETDEALAGAVTAGAVIAGGLATETDEALAGSTTAPTIVNGSLATETDTASSGTVVLHYVVTQRNRTGGRIRQGLGETSYEPPVEAVPATVVLGHNYDKIQWFGDITISGEHPIFEANELDKPRARTRIVVGQRDVTFFRGIATPIPDYQLQEPMSYGPAVLRFPQIVAWCETPGVGALKWLRKGAKVQIQRVDADDNVIAIDYRGFVADYNADGGEFTVECGGELSGRASTIWVPQPLFRTTKDAGAMVYFPVKNAGLPIRPRGGPTTGIELVDNLGNMWLDEKLSRVCSLTQTVGGEQWTIVRGPSYYQFVEKDTTTVDATLYLDSDRVRPNLRRDFAEEPNRAIVSGVTPDGMRVRFGVYPALMQGEAPDYPMDDNSSFGLGTVDADTDSGDGVTVMLWRLVTCGFLSWSNLPGDFDADVVNAVNRLQERAGLGATGQMDPPTWENLFDITKTGYSLAQSHIEPAAQRSRVRRWNRTGSGAIAGRNPDYDQHENKVDIPLEVGGYFTRQQLRQFGRRKLGLDPWMGLTETPNWTGTITLNGHSAIAGQHDPGDPDPVAADILPARALRPGMNVWLPQFDDGTLVHVSGISVSDGGRQVMLYVDTRSRDLLEVWEVIQRNRESRHDPARVKGLRSSAKIPKDIIEYDEVGGVLESRVDLVGGQWNEIPVVAAEAGTIRSIRYETTPATESSVIVSAQPFALSMLDRLLPAPLGEGAGWEDAEVRRAWKARDVLYASGDWQQPNGYFPARKTDEEGPTFALVTGIHEDDAGFSYYAHQYPVLYMYVWVPTDCRIPAGRVMWPQREAGS